MGHNTSTCGCLSDLYDPAGSGSDVNTHNTRPKRNKNKATKTEIVTPALASSTSSNERAEHVDQSVPSNDVSTTNGQNVSNHKDEWSDDNWDDEDQLDDIQPRSNIPDPIDTSNPRMERSNSLPPVLGTHSTFNRLENLDDGDNDDEDGTGMQRHELSEYVICQGSDRPASYDEPGKEYGGLVLYQYDGQTKWNLNGVDCQIGTILLKESGSLPSSTVGQIHGGLYKWFFNESVNTKIVASGFAYYKQKWVYKSRAFNHEDDGHVIRDSEIKCLTKALQNWCNEGQRVTKLEPVLNVYIKDKGEYRAKGSTPVATTPTGDAK